jgi:hypothetical protein
MLRVVSTESELAEDGEVITVGDVVTRVALPFDGAYFGDELDDVPWMFDRYAAGFSDRSDVVVLTGRVVAIAAVYVRLSRDDTDGRVPIPTSSRLASLVSTRDTWRPEPTIIWEMPSASPPEGGLTRGYEERHEGDEILVGWLFTLDETALVALVFP